jgi:antitoxin component of RelBE/YafQ-DinJ toxin-antitoxin module
MREIGFGFFFVAGGGDDGDGEAEALDRIKPKYILQYMQTTVIFKADKKRKELAQKLAKTMGIPFSAVMNRLMDEFIEKKQIVFSAQSFEPTPYLRRILDRSNEDLKDGNYRRFGSIDELMIDLEK